MSLSKSEKIDGNYFLNIIDLKPQKIIGMANTTIIPYAMAEYPIAMRSIIPNCAKATANPRAINETHDFILFDKPLFFSSL